MDGILGKERVLRFPRFNLKSQCRFEVQSASDSRGAASVGAIKSGRGSALLKSAAAICVAGLFAGCDTKDLLNPTAVVRSGRPTEPLVVPILNTFDYQAEAGPGDYATATPPRPSDSVTNSNDYTIGRNDLLNISISDLMGPGQETVKIARVSESGNISLPYLGSVHAAGLTEIELEQGIVQAYRDANLIQNAQVSVTVVEARGRTVEIMGAVQAPGQYAILDADFRLLDALVLAKDVTTPLTDYIYVIRKSEMAHQNGLSPTTKPILNLRPGSGTTGTGHPTSAPTPEDLAPHSDAGSQGSTPTASVKLASANRPLTLLADAPTSEPQIAVPASEPAATQPSAPFAFNAPQSEENVRIIRIPYQGLHAGDLKYNIAIHPRDIIIVQPLPVGEYYLGGHIARPGAFTLSGRRITLKEAVISGGMFDELAIPQRTDIIRRIRPDREVFVRVDLERIFAGEQPDVYLKPDDQVMVGTNAIAPFLAALRGAFRITYGFGFLYDRNFAYNSNTQGP